MIGETVRLMRHRWNPSNINTIGTDCLEDLFTYKELATHTVEPNLSSKRGNKKALDQAKIDLIKGIKTNKKIKYNGINKAYLVLF